MTFDEWWTNNPDSARYLIHAGLAKRVWDAGVTSQQAEIERLRDELRAAEYDRDVVMPAGRADVDFVFEANNRLQHRLTHYEAVVEAARAVARWEGTEYPHNRRAAIDGLRASLAALEVSHSEH